MSRPVVALLTDFGTRDHFVGTMKGVIAGICPDANVIDITHDVPPQDVLTGAIELEAAYRYFPMGTIFVAVVDPGVGSARRGIAARAGSYGFVGPDNGVLTPTLARLSAHGSLTVVALAEGRYTLPVVSRTSKAATAAFAPAAAWLASGVALSALGPPVEGLQQVAIPEPHVGVHGVDGEVLSVDRFGNLRSNIGTETLGRVHGDAGIVVTIADHEIHGLVSTYAEAPTGTLCALVGSSGYLEIAVTGGSAAALVRVSRGTPVRVRRRA